MNFDKEIVNKEEKFYTEKIEELILEQHEQYDLLERKLRVLVNKSKNLETDLVLIVEINGKKRTIGIELKENDIIKAVRQAITRREYFNYFYVVLNLKVSTIVDWLFLDTNLFFAIKDYKIGLISAGENILVYPSKFMNVFKLVVW